MTVETRSAVRGDADGITDVQVASWRAGYAHVFPESVLYADDFDASRRAFWTAWQFLPGHRMSVTTRTTETDPGGRVVGFASYGPERERDRDLTGRGELYAFYFEPAEWGTGSAGLLMEHTVSELRGDGFDQAVLWVLDDNPRARAFYEKHGWFATGIDATFDRYCDVQVPEIEYHKAIT